MEKGQEGSYIVIGPRILIWTRIMGGMVVTVAVTYLLLDEILQFDGPQGGAFDLHGELGRHTGRVAHQAVVQVLEGSVHELQLTGHTAVHLY